MKTTTLLVSALALAFTFGTAMAQTDTKAKKKTSLFSQCSQQATAKGLTGKDRKAFYTKCTKPASTRSPRPRPPRRRPPKPRQPEVQLPEATSGRLDRGARCHLRKAQGPPDR